MLPCAGAILEEQMAVDVVEAGVSDGERPAYDVDIDAAPDRLQCPLAHPRQRAGRAVTLRFRPYSTDHTLMSRGQTDFYECPMWNSLSLSPPLLHCGKALNTWYTTAQHTMCFEMSSTPNS